VITRNLGIVVSTNIIASSKYIRNICLLDAKSFNQFIWFLRLAHEDISKIFAKELIIFLGLNLKNLFQVYQIESKQTNQPSHQGVFIFKK